MPECGNVVVFESAEGLVQASGADGRERALPDGSLVRDGIVGVPSECNSIRKRRQRPHGRTVVIARGTSVARSLRMRMLAVEERLVLGKRRCVLLHIRFDGRIEARPLRPDEGVALHLAAPDYLPLLPAKPLHRLLWVILVAEAMRKHLLLRVAVPASAPRVNVVVAHGNHKLHLAPVGSTTAGEHFVPDGGELLQFVNKPRVRNVARTQHRVHVLRVEPAQRLLELLFRVWLAADVDVANDAERQTRRLAHLPEHAERAERQRTTYKTPT